MPEELLPVATTSVWVRGPKAGHWRVLRYRGVGFDQDAAGLRKLWSVRGVGVKEGPEKLQKAMEGFRGAGWYRRRAVNVGSGAVGAVRGGFVTRGFWDGGRAEHGGWRPGSIRRPSVEHWFCRCMVRPGTGV